MKIRITEEIPTAIKPKVGEVYEVTRTEERKGRGPAGAAPSPLSREEIWALSECFIAG